MDILPIELQPPPQIGPFYIENPSHFPIDDPHSLQVKQLGQVAKLFKWKNHLLDPNRISHQFSDFVYEQGFPLDSDTLTSIVTTSFAFIDQVYDTLFGQNTCPLPYHDIIHTKLTGITAIKIFLGGLVSQPALLDQLTQTGRLKPVIQSFVITSSLHEIDDWLSLPGVTNPDNMSQAIDQISQYLSDQILATVDFDKIIALGDFAKDLPDSLSLASGLQPGDGFLGKLSPNQLPSLFDSQPLLKLAQTSIQAADFLQIANPAYYAPIYFYDQNNDLDSCPASFHSLTALVWEMINFRPKCIKNNPGWLNSDGSLNLFKLRLYPEFYTDIAYLRIKPALAYLQTFSPQEHQRALQSINIVTTFL